METSEIQKLAEILSINHLLSSCDIEQLKTDNNWKNVLNIDAEDRIKHKTVVAVVGAGASSQANLP